jgi:hypothetical protein
MNQVLALSIVVLGMQVSGLADTVAPGTQIEVRADNTINVSKWDRGRIYPAHIARDVYARDGDVAIPRGSYAELIVRQSGPDQLALDLESITVNGRRYALDTAGPEFNARRHDYDNGAGVVGNIIGAIAGAAGADIETHGRELRVPAGAVVRFQLQEPLRVVNWADPGYENRGYHYHRDHDWYR